jgi:triacylglycerol lipase
MKTFTSLQTLLLTLGTGLPVLAQPDNLFEATTNRDCVVLLHGLASAPLWLTRIEWSLERRGYQVHSVSYPSTLQPVERLSREHLARAVAGIKLPPGGQIHFVTHSLGGLVLRHYLAENSLTNLGRVVMLGPPNQGSEIADWLMDTAFYKCVLGPSGQQLGAGADDFPRRLGPVNFPLGVIAGDRSFNPIFSRRLPGPDDGKVSVASTRVEGMSDFVVLRASHTTMIWSRPVIDQVQAFLTMGKFYHREPTSN